ncbi:FAD-dependent monooxygenase [Pendulispora albinea]|uniref:FAD-dependent monooxygenase n=1 Tax=Pendulispora albinea TaxID=2741071 RepID=A0ABZ2LX68_9BACT
MSNVTKLERTSVLIAGAGPVGLMLAGELRLGGVDVVVVETRSEPSGESRGLGFTARATEIFHQRGLLARFGEVETSRQGHFGGIPMDFGVLPGSHFGARGIPQYKIEEMLEGWARELGASVRRRHRLVTLNHDERGVVAVIDGPDGPFELAADYLVGCDGGRSAVRQLAGFDFAGTDATREMYLADVLDRAIRPRYIGERVSEGMVMSMPFAPGVDRIIVCPRGAPRRERTVPIAFDEIADAWQRLTGESLHGAKTRWVSVFTDATRQVTEYRRGRVLLAGDAAHIHLPAGGQGLSLGVMDATNLGWKLAATLRGWAPATLLDSYHTEQHAVGARVLRNTQAQGLLYLSGNEVEPLRAVMAELVALPEVGRLLSGMVSGLAVRHDVGSSEHPLLGKRLPHIPLAGGGSTADLLHRARGVLLGSNRALEGIVHGWTDRVDFVHAAPAERSNAGWPSEVDSLLVRPDGHVAWIAPSTPSTPSRVGVTNALRRWFGEPHRAPLD